MFEMWLAGEFKAEARGEWEEPAPEQVEMKETLGFKMAQSNREETI